MLRSWTWLLIVFSLPGLARAVESSDAVHRERVRAGAWIGPAAVNGILQLRTPTANSDVRLDLLPAVALGVDLWPAEQTGLYLGGAVGVGADIKFPTGQKVRYNLHQFEAGGRYRWHLSGASNALALVGALGVRGLYQTAQEQRPSVLIDRLIAGPELRLGLEWPLLSGRLWLRAHGRAGLPFFVRESPNDSGDPTEFRAFGGHLDVVVKVTGGWSVQLAADVYDATIDFNGQGTRAAGVLSARTHDRFATGGLWLRYAFAD
ncbi:MAG: hypothetical protein KC620_00565 [Myxococcales bacterium]|nr:hypothetical protein [Myxococcales bacterium]